MNDSALKNSWISFIGWFILVALTATIGAYASANAGAFYAQLSKPDWAPPSSLFSTVWTILYLMMVVSVWLVWRQKSVHFRSPEILVFISQLAVNALWSWLFFVWKSGPAAFAGSALLLIMVFITMLLFLKIHRFAAALLIPYVLWVAFATYLTWAIWQRNPDLL